MLHQEIRLLFPSWFSEDLHWPIPSSLSSTRILRLEGQERSKERKERTVEILAPKYKKGGEGAVIMLFRDPAGFIYSVV